MAELTEKIRREAYAAGWRDALSAISKAVTDSRPGDVPPADFGSDERRDDTGAGAAQSGPAVGTIPHYVLAGVKRHPGSTGSEIVAAIRADNNKFGEPQIRLALHRLGKRKPPLIINRHGRWFPT